MEGKAKKKKIEIIVVVVVVVLNNDHRVKVPTDPNRTWLHPYLSVTVRHSCPYEYTRKYASMRGPFMWYKYNRYFVVDTQLILLL